MNKEDEEEEEEEDERDGGVEGAGDVVSQAQSSRKSQRPSERERGFALARTRGVRSPESFSSSCSSLMAEHRYR